MTTCDAQSPGTLIGKEPLDRVYLMENHDQAYYTWRERGVKNRVLVHIDAHHDMWWIPERGSITIANFIYAALRDDCVRELFWVVPDPTWERSKTREPILHHLKTLGKKYPGGARPIQIGDRQISTILLGKRFTVCPLRLLPQVDENVLLDIDIDFFTIPRVCFGQWDTHAELPWCWPEGLLARLTASRIRTDLVTIGYSVVGGYTPLKWKYLGDELAQRSRQGKNDDVIRGMDLIRAAALAAHASDLVSAERIYREAAGLLPNSAAPCYHLAYLCLGMGRVDEGRTFYQEALARDPSYRTAYNNSGLWHGWAGNALAAEREHWQMLQLDPGDAFAHFGLGRLAARRKRWAEAEACLREALALDPYLIDAYRILGKVLAKRGCRDAAIEAYRRSLSLALEGYRPLGADIVTYPEEARLADPSHWYTHGRLARLHEAQGSDKEAISSYRMAIAGGCDGFLIRGRLARLYIRQRNWQKGSREAWQAAKKIPAGLWRTALRGHYRLRRAAAKRYKSFLPI